MSEIVRGRRSCDRLAPQSGLKSMPGTPVKAIVVGSWKFISCGEGAGHSSGLNIHPPQR